MRMLIFAGIETKTINYYVAAVSKNQKKTLSTRRCKKCYSKTPGTNNTVYEVIYVEVIEQNDGLTKASFSQAILIK